MWTHEKKKRQITFRQNTCRNEMGNETSRRDISTDIQLGKPWGTTASRRDADTLAKIAELIQGLEEQRRRERESELRAELEKAEAEKKRLEEARRNEQENVDRLRKAEQAAAQREADARRAADKIRNADF